MQKVTKGFGTWVGVAFAISQYAASVGVFLAADDPALALGPLATATATLYKVLDGRFNQAVAAIENPKVPASLVQPVTSGAIGGTAVSGVGTTWTSGRPGVEMTNVPARDPYANSIPAGSVPAEDGQ